MGYPEHAIQNTKGRLIITFIAGADGRLTDVKVVKGIGDGDHEGALKGTNYARIGKPVRTA